MKELKLVSKEIKCDVNGKGWVTVAGLARLASVTHEQAKSWVLTLSAQQLQNNCLYSTGNDSTIPEFISDTLAVEFVTVHAIKGSGKAITTMSQFAAVGLRTMIQTQSGYDKPTSNELLELLESRKKLAYCKIDDNCMKAIIEERSNHKVSEITNIMGELGIVQITDAVRHYKKITSTDIGDELGVKIVNNTPIYPEVMHDKIRDVAATKALLQQKIRNLKQGDVFGYDE